MVWVLVVRSSVRRGGRWIWFWRSGQGNVAMWIWWRSRHEEVDQTWKSCLKIFRMKPSSVFTNTESLQTNSFGGNLFKHLFSRFLKCETIIGAPIIVLSNYCTLQFWTPSNIAYMSGVEFGEMETCWDVTSCYCVRTSGGGNLHLDLSLGRGELPVWGNQRKLSTFQHSGHSS